MWLHQLLISLILGCTTSSYLPDSWVRLFAVVILTIYKLHSEATLKIVKAVQYRPSMKGINVKTRDFVFISAVCVIVIQSIRKMSHVRLKLEWG